MTTSIADGDEVRDVGVARLEQLTTQTTKGSGLEVLRRRIRAANVPAARPGNLRIATWNIREFGKTPRLPESIALLAEIVRTFDLVSVVELRDNLGDLAKLRGSLGRGWQVVFSDYLRDFGGNRERSAFLFNSKRVRFNGLASTAEGPRVRKGAEYLPTLPWWRPPFLASFRAGRFDFILLAAHVRWGATVAARLSEIEALGDWIGARKKERFLGDNDLIVVGDFNVDAGSARLREILETRGLAMAPGLDAKVETSLAKNRRYDQILCLPRETLCFSGKAGAVDFSVGDHRPLMAGRRMSKDRFTLQLSDHLPLWAELLARRDGESPDQGF